MGCGGGGAGSVNPLVAFLPPCNQGEAPFSKKKKGILQPISQGFPPPTSVGGLSASIPPPHPPLFGKEHPNLAEQVGKAARGEARPDHTKKRVFFFPSAGSQADGLDYSAHRPECGSLSDGASLDSRGLYGGRGEGESYEFLLNYFPRSRIV